MNDYTNVLLTSENRIKSISPLSDNLAGKYLLPTIKIVQDVHLRTTIGSCLLTALQQMIAEGTINDEKNLIYKDLLDNYIQPYMAHQVLSEIVELVANKIVNAGVTQVNDEHQNNSYRPDKNDLKLTYLRHADSYKRLMQEFLLQHASEIPELEECICSQIRSNLQTANSGGLWLGGPRGKMYRRPCKNC